MKTQIFFWLVVVCGISCWPVRAQSTSEIELLRKQLEAATEAFQKTLSEQQGVIEELRRRLDALPEQSAGTGGETNRSMEHPGPSTAGAADEAGGGRHGSAPVTVAGQGGKYLNVSLDALFAVGASTAEDIGALQIGGHDPNQRGFTVQNVEAVLSGAVDPYLKAQANLIFQIDADGETLVELEEAYAESSSLPGNLQLKAGQYFSEFGRHNPTHPHAWAFVDQPLVAGRFFGPDGLRNPGARLSWLAPTPFYSELFLSVQDSHGETAESFRGDHEGELFLGRVHATERVGSLSDLLFVPRYAVSFDLTDAQTVLAGISAAVGPNASGADTGTQVYGADLLWKWKSRRHHAGFPFVAWQSEVMLRKYEAGAFSEDFDGDSILDLDVDADGIIDSVPGETLTDYGFYSQFTWGFRKGWVAGLRGEYAGRSGRADYELEFGDDPGRTDRWRLSPNLSWYPTEFSKVRLQYNLDHRAGIGDDHSVWLQLEFLLGSHGAHMF